MEVNGSGRIRGYNKSRGKEKRLTEKEKEREHRMRRKMAELTDN